MEKLITRKQLATYLGCSESSLEKNVYKPAQERIPYIKFGRLVRFRVSEVQVWLERKATDQKM